MKRRGAFIVEIIIAMAVFAIGVIAIASALTFSLGAITASREAVSANLGVINDINVYMAERVISHDVTLETATPAAGTSINKISSGNTITIGNKEIKYSIYRYKLDAKKSSSYYILQRED